MYVCARTCYGLKLHAINLLSAFIIFLLVCANLLQINTFEYIYMYMLDSSWLCDSAGDNTITWSMWSKKMAFKLFRVHLEPPCKAAKLFNFYWCKNPLLMSSNSKYKISLLHCIFIISFTKIMLKNFQAIFEIYFYVNKL